MLPKTCVAAFKPPKIPVHLNKKANDLIVLNRAGVNLAGKRQWGKSEMSRQTISMNKAAREKMKHKLDWHFKEMRMNNGKLERRQDFFYKMKIRLHKDKVRIAREVFKREQETLQKSIIRTSDFTSDMSDTEEPVLWREKRKNLLRHVLKRFGIVEPIRTPLPTPYDEVDVTRTMKTSSEDGSIATNVEEDISMEAYNVEGGKENGRTNSYSWQRNSCRQEEHSDIFSYPIEDPSEPIVLSSIHEEIRSSVFSPNDYSLKQKSMRRDKSVSKKHCSQSKLNQDKNNEKEESIEYLNQSDLITVMHMSKVVLATKDKQPKTITRNFATTYTKKPSKLSQSVSTEAEKINAEGEEEKCTKYVNVVLPTVADEKRTAQKNIERKVPTHTKDILFLDNDITMDPKKFHSENDIDKINSKEKPRNLVAERRKKNWKAERERKEILDNEEYNVYRQMTNGDFEVMEYHPQPPSYKLPSGRDAYQRMKFLKGEKRLTKTLQLQCTNFLEAFLNIDLTEYGNQEQSEVIHVQS